MRDSKIKANIIKTLIFVSISVCLVIVTDLLILDNKRSAWKLASSYISMDDPDVNAYELREQHSSYMNGGIYIEPEMVVISRINSDIDSPPSIAEFEQDIVIVGEKIIDDEIIAFANIEPAVGVYIEPEVEVFTGIEPEVYINVEAKIDDTVISKSKDDYKYTEPKGAGMIAVIIDDMGVSLRSKQVEVLSGPLTLAYLPYADNLAERTRRASANGHELMLHMPMEPMNTKIDGGPKVLRGSLGNEEFIEVLEWGLSSFDGFVGLNNHMGSRLTKDKDAMQRLMSHLKGKDLFFIDSKTIGSSVAADTARDNGIPYAVRDVFIDHEISMEFLRSSLKKLEDVANRNGYAIAIGHPHKETIAALKEWLPTLEGKGLTLVPASKLIKHPIAAEAAAVAAN